MIATMTLQSQHTDPLFSRNSNTAGAPLPGIPRRLSSGTKPRSAPSTPPPSSSSKITVVVQQSTPPPSSQPTVSTIPYLSSDSGLRESSSRLDVPNLTATQVCPPELSTPTPAVHNARLEQHRQPLTTPESTPKSSNVTSDASRRHSWIYTPGMSLRLTTEQLKIRNFSESHAGPSSTSTLTPSRSSSSSSSSSTEPRLIRKKSGQLVKSSLKPSKSLTVVTRSLASKSEPNTPTHVKAVHFDAQLEHVKLFLAEQKPLAVSRDGSPTEDTSGTDTDFPSFIFGSDGDEKRKNLVMRTPNMPPRLKSNADVVLESLKLSPDSRNITGKVRVRNLAFSKWVVARFTFDEWQTTSEVTAAYSESLSAEFDVFVFSVRLNDLLARIEGKKMWLAVRYSIGDREMWDNNDSKNYLAEFSVGATSASLKGPSPEKERGRGRSRSLRSSSNMSPDSSPATSERDIADLRSKLEKVVVQPPRPKLSPSHPAFSARYTFPSSQPESWKSSFDSSDHSHIHLRTRSYPMSTPTSTATPTPRLTSAVAPFKFTPNSIPWPEKEKKIPPPLGSPRDADGDVLFSTHRKSFEVEDVSLIPTSVSDSGNSSTDSTGGYSLGRGGIRKHRRGYFAGARMVGGIALKRTSPGTPSSSCDSLEEDEESTPTMSRLYSLDSQRSTNSAPPMFGLGLGPAFYGDESESSEQSTPSLSSSRDSSPSPTESMLYARDGTVEGVKLSPDTNYREFLSRFCFFTGSGTQGSQMQLLSPSPNPSPSPNSGSDSRHHTTHTRAHTHPYSDDKKQPIDISQGQQKQQAPGSAIEFVLSRASPSLQHRMQGLDEPSYVLAAATTVSLDDIASFSPRSGSATPQLMSPTTVVTPVVA